MGLLKELAKRLPYPLFLRLFYARDMRTRVRHADQVRKRLGLPLLSDCDLAGYKTSDTLFVLGGGASINRIPPQRWQAIAAHDSASMNMWLFHPFVPTFYFTEAVSEEEAPAVYTKFQELMERRASDYQRVIKIAMELHKPGRLNLEHLPAGFRQNFFAALNLSVPARSSEEFAYGLRFLKARGWLARETRITHLLKYAMSVTTMLALAVKLAYRNVVLCGFDITSSEYFYHDPQLFPDSANWEFTPRRATHFTEQAMDWKLPATVALEVMRRELLQPAGVQLYVENRSSGLWPSIPEAPESLFTVPAQRIHAELRQADGSH